MELFESQVARCPEATAVVQGETSLSYSELNGRANQLAHYLIGLGVGPESLVGVCLERSFELVVSLLGILKAGGAYVPLDPSYPPARLAFMITDTQMPLMLTQRALKDQLPETHARVVCLDTNIPQHTSTERHAVADGHSDQLAYLMYTSGSTGRPRGVAVTHRNVIRLVRNTHFARIDAQETFLLLAPISFDASTFELWGPLLNGGKLVLAPSHSLSLQELGYVIAQHQVSTIWLTAGLFHVMVNERPEGLRPLRQVLAGGDVLSVDLVRKTLRELPGCQLINRVVPQ